MDIKDRLKLRCQTAPACLGLPDSADPRILEVARTMLLERSVRQIALYTPEAATRQLAAQANIDLEGVAWGLRWICKEELSSSERVSLAARQLTEGHVDAVLAGNIATTAEVIRAGIKIVGITPGVRTVSGAFLMHKPRAPHGQDSYLYADCSVVIQPTTEQLVDIATEAVRTWSSLHPERPPVVAFLSFSTKGSAKHPAQAAMAEAALLFKQRFPNVTSDGEIQFDAAFDAAIGQRKAPGSPVPGHANCLIFPDLNAGNIAYKITQRLGGYEAYGPVLQGLRLPMNDLSRGATLADILTSAYMTLARV